MAAPGGVSTTGVRLDAATTTASVQRYYGETLTSSVDLQTSACCAAGAPPARVRRVLAHPAFPAQVLDTFYGCGSPLPLGIEGLRVLDLGCGSGRDCYVASALVGPRGAVTGLDFTPQLLEVATRHASAWAAALGHDNMRFKRSRIEDLAAAGVAPGSVDLVRGCSERPHVRACSALTFDAHTRPPARDGPGD